MLHEERRIWVDWEEYLHETWFQSDGTTLILEQLPRQYFLFSLRMALLLGNYVSFVQNLRGGDVFLLGGQTYRVHAINSTRVNVIQSLDIVQQSHLGQERR